MNKKVLTLIVAGVVLVAAAGASYFAAPSMFQGKLALDLPAAKNKDSIVVGKPQKLSDKKVTDLKLHRVPESFNLGDNFHPFKVRAIKTSQTNYNGVKRKLTRIGVQTGITLTAGELGIDSGSYSYPLDYVSQCKASVGSEGEIPVTEHVSFYVLYTFFDFFECTWSPDNPYYSPYKNKPKYESNYYFEAKQGFYEYLKGFTFKAVKGFYDEKGFDAQAGTVKTIMDVKNEDFYGEFFDHVIVFEFDEQPGIDDLYTLRIVSPYNKGVQLKSGLYFISCSNNLPDTVASITCDIVEKK